MKDSHLRNDLALYRPSGLCTIYRHLENVIILFVDLWQVRCRINKLKAFLCITLVEDFKIFRLEQWTVRLQLCLTVDTDSHASHSKLCV